MHLGMLREPGQQFLVTDFSAATAVRRNNITYKRDNGAA
jgi:hypothetical protein